jgi:hypothetical protein
MFAWDQWACYNDPMTGKKQSRSLQVQIGLCVLGLVLVAVSIGADVIGLDLTPGFGVFQALGSLVGITLLTTAAYLYLARGRKRGEERTLLADVGLRMGLTGLLTCYVAGLADMLGVGTHQGPDFERPFLGPLQIAGVALGLFLVLVGLFLFWLGRSRPGSESQY